MTENSHKMTKLAPQVVVLAYDGLCTFEFGVAVEIFGLPRPSGCHRSHPCPLAA